MLSMRGSCGNSQHVYYKVVESQNDVNLTYRRRIFSLILSISFLRNAKKILSNYTSTAPCNARLKLTAVSTHFFARFRHCPKTTKRRGSVCGGGKAKQGWGRQQVAARSRARVRRAGPTGLGLARPRSRSRRVRRVKDRARRAQGGGGSTRTCRPISRGEGAAGKGNFLREARGKIVGVGGGGVPVPFSPLEIYLLSSAGLS